MKKIGSLQFYKDIDLNLKFNFDDICDEFNKTADDVKDEFFDENNMLKLDIVDKYSEEYVNRKIREKYGEDYSLDVMDDTMNISWDVKVETIKQHQTEDWWNKAKLTPIKAPKIKK